MIQCLNIEFCTLNGVLGWAFFFFYLGSERFDVAGAGTCLKRYTDPSFFIVESASSGKVTVEVQMENKIHKVKVLKHLFYHLIS